MDSNFRYRGAKAAGFRSIPGIAGVSARLLNGWQPGEGGEDRGSDP